MKILSSLVSSIIILVSISAFQGYTGTIENKEDILIDAYKFTFIMTTCQVVVRHINVVPPSNKQLNDRVDVVKILDKAAVWGYTKCKINDQRVSIHICQAGIQNCSSLKAHISASKNDKKGEWNWIKDTAIRTKETEQLIEKGELRKVGSSEFLRISALVGNTSSTNATFWVRRSNKTGQKCDAYMDAPTRHFVLGIGGNFDQMDDAVVKNILTSAAQGALNTCWPTSASGYDIILVPENFSLDARGAFWPTHISSFILISGARVSGGMNEYTFQSYFHHARAEAEKAAIEREKQAQQAAIAKEKQQVQNRLDRMDTENGVQAWPGIAPLMANPFVYKDKVIAMAATFQQMTSATDGVFDAGKGVLVISDIPEGLLVSPGRTIVVGVVLGQTEVSVPIVGKILAPHLKYVDIFKCSTGDLHCKEALDKKFQ